jgi:hypothetical protein
MLLVDVPGNLPIGSGDRLADVPIIGSPYSAHLDRVYLFPTLPRQTGEKEYLLGILAADVDGTSKQKPSEPARIKISIIASDPAVRRDVELPVHRGRSGYRSEGNEGVWSLDLKPLPVLAVRAMWGDALKGMPETATQLRNLPLVVLDLRANGGGSDTWATKWVSGFSSQYYLDCAGVVDLRRGETDPLRRYECRFRCGDTVGPRGPDKRNGSSVYQGRLFVLTDNSCASSGETFVHLAAQIPGTVVVGENTGGFFSCMMGDMFRFPHTDLAVEFGGRKLFRGGRECPEGTGMFPDYWLDDPDPVTAIAAYSSLK